MPVEESSVLVDGPWRHRSVAANGARFHVAECGPADGPLVLLLHGFPQFWWAWRDQFEPLVAAGFRVAALDLRGYGASDKPPGGYDLENAAADVSGVIRSLGEEHAVVIGHDLGGAVGWALAALHSDRVWALGAIAAPHPNLLLNLPLVGARNLDPPEAAFMEAAGIDDSVERAAAGVDAVYVALDLDVLDPSEVDVLIPEPDGLSADEVEALLRDLAAGATIAGMGVTGFLATDRNAALACRMLAAAGF